MDYASLVAEIVSKVQAKLSSAEERPQMLVLGQPHNKCCGRIIENDRMNGNFNISCALDGESLRDVNRFEAVILCGLSNCALGKIASGCCDDPYSSSVSRAIMLGKKIYLPEEELELFGYKGSAPQAYYGMMLGKLSLLERSGVILCSYETLESAVLCDTPAVLSVESAVKRKEKCSKKKVITEQDLYEAHREGVTTLIVGAKTILTDLAKEYAHLRSIEILKDQK